MSGFCGSGRSLRAVGKMSDLELMQHQFAFCAADTSQSQLQTGVMRDRSSQEERLLNTAAILR